MAFRGLVPFQPPLSIKLTSVAHTLTTIATKGRIAPATCKSWCCSKQKVERGFMASKPRLSEYSRVLVRKRFKTRGQDLIQDSPPPATQRQAALTIHAKLRDL
jgi:hypothetical protein